MHSKSLSIRVGQKNQRRIRNRRSQRKRFQNKQYFGKNKYRWILQRNRPNGKKKVKPRTKQEERFAETLCGSVDAVLGCSCCLEFWRRVIWDTSPEFRLRRCWQQRSRFWVLEHLGCGQVRKRRKSRTKQRNGERKSAGNLQMPQGILKKQNSTKSSGMSTEKDCSSKNQKRQITVRQSFFQQEQSRDRPAL